MPRITAKVKIEEISSTLRSMTVSLPGEDVSKQIHQRTLELTKSVSLPGFRKGKVPIAVIKTRFADDIESEIISAMTFPIVEKVFEEDDIRPLAQPVIKSYGIGELSTDWQVNVEYEVMPEVQCTSLSGESITYPVIEISEQDLGYLVDNAIRKNLVSELVKEPVQMGDFVDLDVDLILGNESLWDAPQSMIMDTLDQPEQRHESIEQALPHCLGRSAGDEFTVSVPDNSYEMAELYGNELPQSGDSEPYYKIVVREVQRPVPGRLNDDFVDDLGISDLSDENVRSAVEKYVIQSYDKLRDFVLNQLIESLLLDKNTFSPPEKIVRANVSSKLRGLGWDSKKIELELRKGGDGDFIPLFILLEMRTTKLNVIRSKICAERNITVDSEYIAEQMRLDSERLQSRFRNFASSNPDISITYEDYAESIVTVRYRERKVFEVLLAEMQKNEERMGYYEFMNWCALQKKRMFDLKSDMDATVDDDRTVVDFGSEINESRQHSVILDSSGNPIEKRF